MTSRKDVLIATLLTLSIIDAALFASQAMLFDSTSRINIVRERSLKFGFEDEPITPLPISVDINPRVAALGKKLFHDPRLSKDNSISCATCHNLSAGGMDGKRVSTGIAGQEGELNAPTVFNSSANTRQFWDGRAESLEDQVSGPLTNPGEMGTNWPDVIARLNGDRSYIHEFEALFPDGITSANIASAIADFERTLITPNARFDKFLRGDASAITEEEKQGYQLFKAYGCATCHQGAAAGGNMFERLGSVRDYFADHGPETKVDLGRYNITRIESHRHYFKVPSLRNVEKTAPYFHNGKASTLEEAVRQMAFYNLGVVMPEKDVSLITGFLRTLTGEYEGKSL